MKENKNNGVNLVDLFFYLLSNWYWFVICIGLFVGFTYYKYSKTRHLFQSDATIIIKDPSNAKATVQLNNYSSLINRVSMSNEILQLRSRELMMEVVRSLDADIDYIIRDRLRDVELYSVSPVRMFIPREGADDLVFSVELRPMEGGIVELKYGGNQQMVALGDTVSLFGTQAVFQPTSEYDNYLDRRIRIIKNGVTPRALQFLSRLTVSQAETDGSILRLSIQDYAFRRANDVLNTLVTKYNDDAIREKNRIAVNTAAFINERLAIIEDELGDVEQDIAHFKSSERIMDVESAAADYLSRSKEYSTQLTSVESKIEMARFMQDYLASSFKSYVTIPINTGLNDAKVDAAIQEYNTLIKERDALVKASSEQSPAVVQSETRIATLRRDILGYIGSLIGTLNSQKENLSTLERDNMRKFTSMPTKARELLSIERQQKIKETLYIFLLNKREENALTQAMADNNARMIDSAVASWTPVYPSRNKMLMLAFLAGILLPGIILLMRVMVDTRVRNRRDIEEVTDMPFLADLPLAREKKPKKGEEQRLTTAYSNSKSKVFTEAMRLMCTNLDFMRPEGCTHPVVATTSFQSSAGKTFVSTNIAVCLADAKKRVVFIDMDLRKRTASKFFSLKHGVAGLSNYIYDDSMTLETILHKNILGGVDFIPAGHIPPNPAELLSRGRFEELINTLREKYDYVLLDGVPVNAVADMMVTQKLIDMNLFVIRCGKIDRRVMPELDVI